jgi:uncharacterized membrane protein YeaQ/YmgE (transglycosylase-associated protein family)
MTLGFAIIAWMSIGAFAGLMGNRIMGNDAKHGALANVFLGVFSALIAGFVTQTFVGGAGYNGIGIGFAGALLGCCVVTFVWGAASRRRAAQLIPVENRHRSS